MLVVVTTPPLMLSVFGAIRIALPLDEVATSSRIRPSDPVTIRLTVPIVVPPLPFTVRPVVRPGRALLETEARDVPQTMMNRMAPTASSEDRAKPIGLPLKRGR